MSNFNANGTHAAAKAPYFTRSTVRAGIRAVREAFAYGFITAKYGIRALKRLARLMTGSLVSIQLFTNAEVVYFMSRKPALEGRSFFDAVEFLSTENHAAY